jgi:tetratricopeptide (TPR) repeat protein
MKKNQLLVILISVLMAAGLFLLPKVVVKDDEKLATTGEQATVASAGMPSMQPDIEELHSKDVAPEDAEKLNSLRNNFQTVSDKQKKVIFADSLASMFIKMNKLDSAALYFDKIAQLQPNDKNTLRAAESYYEAFSFAVNPEKGNTYNVRARELYNQVLERNPKDLEVKARLAMTYVSSENPMQGVAMLREVLEADPNNEQAIFNLGILSLQSGQYDKAEERFKKLVAINPNHLQGRFYLAVSYLEHGHKEEAREQLEIVKSLDKDPAVQATVEGYLKDLQK